MKFYNRDQELALMDRIEKSSRKSAQMTFLVGRRRIGKTSLLMEAFKGKDCLYFFVARKNESLLCLEFQEEVNQKLNVQFYNEWRTFKEAFGFLMELSKARHFTLIIDEFQEFRTVNASVFSEMQQIWDLNKGKSKMNLILCGSVYSMMIRLFENSREPLFGRATQRVHLKSFDVVTLEEILKDHYPKFTGEDLLAFFLITGGIPKYVEILVQKRAFTKNRMIQEVIDENSLFLEEGKNVLVEEFGKDYANYFSILSLIASGKTSRVEIESIMEIQAGGFLDRLENEYNLIRKVRPILAKPSGRLVKYAIEDNFLNFWFRFIYKYRSAVEAGNIDYLKKIVDRDYNIFSGKILEKYFIEKIKLEKKYNLIGTYWERGNQNEIDIVAVNDASKTVLFAEVKRNKKSINPDQLKTKSEALISKFQGYKFLYKGYSLEDLR